MPTILITPAAESDLITLWVYIARDNRVAADKVYERWLHLFGQHSVNFKWNLCPWIRNIHPKHSLNGPHK